MFNKIWDWLNGNKTLIGTLILAVAEAGIIPMNDSWHSFLVWAGTTLAGVGLAHKVFKKGK